MKNSRKTAETAAADGQTGGNAGSGLRFGLVIVEKISPLFNQGTEISDDRFDFN